MRDISDLLAVPPGKADLAAIDPRGTPGLPDDKATKKAIKKDPKRWSRDEVAAMGEELAAFQERLYAAAKKDATTARVLLVLQSMDCGGKDGTTSNVTMGQNPAGIKVVSFGAPNEEELQHDFLWRIRRGLPPAGYFGIFNRSHYEDVLVARVHELVPEDVWSQRYDAINASRPNRPRTA